jgi:DNA (cytosine-5)-methyltransferase 1
MPRPTHHRAGLGILDPWKTVRDAFAGLPPEPHGTELPNRILEIFGARVQGPFSESEIHVGRTYQPDSIRRYDHIAPGRGRLDLPEELQYECWRRKKSGTTDVLGRLLWDAPSVTIRTEFFKPEKGRYLHPRWDPVNGIGRANRALTHAEAARLQSFPSDFLWCGRKLGIARQIGNAVPPMLAFEIARQSVHPVLHGEQAQPWQRKAPIAEMEQLVLLEAQPGAELPELASPTIS